MFKIIHAQFIAPGISFTLIGVARLEHSQQGWDVEIKQNRQSAAIGWLWNTYLGDFGH